VFDWRCNKLNSCYLSVTTNARCVTSHKNAHLTPSLKYEVMHKSNLCSCCCSCAQTTETDVFPCSVSAEKCRDKLLLKCWNVKWNLMKYTGHHFVWNLTAAPHVYRKSLYCNLFTQTLWRNVPAEVGFYRWSRHALGKIKGTLSIISVRFMPTSRDAAVGRAM